LRCPSDCGPKMRPYLDRLNTDRVFNKSQQEKIFTEIDEVIIRTQGPSSLARL